MPWRWRWWPWWAASLCPGRACRGRRVRGTEGNIHEEDIRYIVERGLTLGCDLDGLRYCPDQPVSRAEMATFLTRALRLDTTVPYLGVYADVGKGAWYTPYVEAMGAYGLTDTQVSGNYRPGDPMLRSEMAIFLQKAFRLSSTRDASTSSFQDIPADAPYAAAADAILEVGITRGCRLDPLLYCPDDTVRRDTMAASWHSHRSASGASPVA